LKKIFLIITILSFIIQNSIYAADKWDKVDYSLLTVMIVTDVLDWQQTRYIASNPDRFKENNPVLGSHPSQRDVDLYFAATCTGQVLIAHYLPTKYRKYWLGLWIGIESGCIVYNNSIGIRIQW